MSLLGLFGSGGLLDSKDSGGLLGKHFSPNMPLLMTGLGMMGGGWGGALPGLQAGMQHQRQAQGVKDWESVIGGMGGGQGAPQPPAPMPAVPSPMPGIGGPSPATPAGGMRAAAGSLPGNYGGDYVNRVVGIESGGNPNAESKTSSATGAGQFINSTWLNTVKKHRPDVAAGKSDPQILALRTDPALSREMVAAYARDNAEFLQSRGLGTGPTEVYAAHNLGPAGAAKVLSASPDTPLAALFGADVMQANPHLRNMTAGTYRQSIASKMGGGAPAPQAAGGGAVPSPQQQATFVAGLDPQKRQALARLAATRPEVASAILTSMFKAQGAGEAFTLGENQVRYGPQGNVIARGPEKQEKPQETWIPLTTPQERAAFGIPADSKQAWQYNPVTKKLQAEGSGGGQTVNVNNRGETEYDKARGKGFADEAERIQKEGREAEIKVAQYQRLDALLSDPNVYTGTGGESIQALKKLGKTMFGLEIKGGGSAEAAQKIVSELALQMGQLMKPMSDSDRKFLESLPPNLSNSAEGRKFIVQMTIDAERRKQQIAELARTYEKTVGRLDADWESTLADWLKENPMFTPERQAQIKALAEGTAQPPPTAGTGWRIRNPVTGKTRVWNAERGMWVDE